MCITKGKRSVEKMDKISPRKKRKINKKEKNVWWICQKNHWGIELKEKMASRGVETIRVKTRKKKLNQVKSVQKNDQK